MISEGERNGCVDFLKSLFENPERRKAWFFRYLSVLKDSGKTVECVLRAHIEVMLYEPVAIQFHSHGLQLTSSMVIPNESLLKDEMVVLNWMRTHQILLFQQQGGACLFNGVITGRHRDLLFRDYIQLCCQRSKTWPKYLLIIIQRMIAVENKKNNVLHQAQRVLQGYLKPEEWVL
jgi:hypothetical protein